MSKIKILSPAFVELATINVASSASRFEKINADNSLAFSVAVKKAAAAFVNDDNLVELDGDYFDIASYKKEQPASNGLRMVVVECEHVSYRLNNPEFYMEYYAQTGTPTAILTEILAGTGFTVGTVDFSAAVTYSAQEKKSRRGLLMEFIAYIGGEAEFSGFSVSIRTQRGSATAKPLTVGKNITLLSKQVDKRNRLPDGSPTVAYACGAINAGELTLGDAVTLLDADLDINATLRIVSIRNDPYNPKIVGIEVGNSSRSIIDDLYRIETSTLVKGKTYYGARISPENGFESIRNDKMARGVFNADKFALQSGDGSGTSWVDRVYFDAATGMYIFDGTLSATTIEALKAQIDVVISNTMITNVMTAQKGYIADLTVDEIDTSRFIPLYLAGNKGIVKYWRGYEQRIDFYRATYAGDINGQPQTVQVTNRNGDLLYWLDAENIGKGITLDATAYPVLRYVYNGTDGMGLLTLTIRDDNDPETGYDFPMVIFGSGNAAGRMKGYLYKDSDEMVMAYESSSGEMREIRLGEDGVFITPYELERITFGTNGFSVEYSGTMYDWAWTKDGAGKITQLVIDGRTIPVTWPS